MDSRWVEVDGSLDAATNARIVEYSKLQFTVSLDAVPNARIVEYHKLPVSVSPDAALSARIVKYNKLPETRSMTVDPMPFAGANAPVAMVLPSVEVNEASDALGSVSTTVDATPCVTRKTPIPCESRSEPLDKSPATRGAVEPYPELASKTKTLKRDNGGNMTGIRWV